MDHKYTWISNYPPPNPASRWSCTSSGVCVENNYSGEYTNAISCMNNCSRNNNNVNGFCSCGTCSQRMCMPPNNNTPYYPSYFPPYDNGYNNISPYYYNSPVFPYYPFQQYYSPPYSYSYYPQSLLYYNRYPKQHHRERHEHHHHHYDEKKSDK
jgi:hypothetical protein